MNTRIQHHGGPNKEELHVRTEKPIPHIVCLCGSTKFMSEFMDSNYRETMKGHIVLSVGFFMHAQGNMHGGTIGANEEQKANLDELHLRKIDLADEVFCVNVRPLDNPNGYIGRSTRRELWYARRKGKGIRFLNPILRDDGSELDSIEVQDYVDRFFPNWAAWEAAATEASKVAQPA